MFNIFDKKPAFHVSIVIVNKPKIQQILISVSESQYKKILKKLYKDLNINNYFGSLRPNLNIINKITAETITSAVFPEYHNTESYLSNKELLACEAFDVLEKDESLTATGNEARNLILAFPQKLLLSNVKTNFINNDELDKTQNRIEIQITSLRTFI